MNTNKSFFLVSIFLMIAANLFSQKLIHVPADYSKIQEALDNANTNDTILVEPGRYYENLVWPEVSGLKLISSGNSQNTIVDGNAVGRVIEINGFSGNAVIDQSTIIDGFTITSGHVIGDHAYGGGIYLADASPVLKNLIIRGNKITGEWSFGAGIYLTSSSPVIENVNISENISESTSWNYGCGLYCFFECNPYLKNVFITNNRMADGANWYYGGGLDVEERSHADLVNVFISTNEMGNGGGTYHGGGISCSDNSSINLTNCTVTNNFRKSGGNIEGGGLYLEGSESRILNSILWNDKNSPEILLRDFISVSTIEVSYSDIRGGYSGEGNISADPLFLSKESLALKPESPCLGRGTLIHAPQDDILGNVRPSPVRSNPDMGALEMDQNFSHVLAVVYYDENSNKIFDKDEVIHSGASIQINPFQKTFFLNNTNGILAILGIGNYTIGLDKTSLPDWQLTTTKETYQVNVNSKDFADTLYFGVEPSDYYSEMITNIYSPPTRCNETVKFSIFAKNEGTLIENGTLWFKMDERIQTFDFINKPDTFISPNMYGWYYRGLYPGQSIQKCVNIKIPGIDVVGVGGKLHFKSFLEIWDQTFRSKSNEFCYDPEVRCSMDPNDKTANPLRENNYTLFSEDIIYTIRFQNTGNDYAYNVIIRDTLDSNLDWSSFKILNSSHPENLITEISNSGVVSFEFNNIYLPDSTRNKIESNGYVTYKIKTKANLPENVNVKNSASIYFDFNPPIHTNRTQNIMVEKLPTLVDNPIDQNPDFIVFPNPARDEVVLTSNSLQLVQFKIFNGNGQVIQNGTFNSISKLNVKQFNNGIYFIEFIIGRKVAFEKLLIKH